MKTFLYLVLYSALVWCLVMALISAKSHMQFNDWHCTHSHVKTLTNGTLDICDQMTLDKELW